MTARQACEAVATEPLRRLSYRRLVVVGDWIAVGRLVAGEPQRVERERILVGGRPPFLDQATKHALFGWGQFGQVHGASIIRPRCARCSAAKASHCVPDQLDRYIYPIYPPEAWLSPSPSSTRFRLRACPRLDG